MPLSPGDKLGPHEILSAIGAGGMGEVYKARDTRLDRTVAIKVLPEHIAKRDDLRVRFEREARAVASLKHPNICVLHDIGNHDGVGSHMVMELLEGETLAARIEKGALPLDQALKFATQIADALDRAHRAGVTHRDVKPQNIMLTRDGVKVLDFGLAKSAASKPGPTEATLTNVPTTEGTVMGTPQYMAPEQFEGKEADARSDIWAFGAVLYEMVTGQKAFQGKSYSSLIGAILSADPAPMSVKPFTPAWLERLVRRCLAKDPEERYFSMHDIVLDLRTPQQESAAVRPSKASRWFWAVAGLAGALALALAILAFIHFHATPPPEQTLRYTIAAPENSTVHSFAISPDGRALVMAAQVGAKRQLWLRPLDALQAQPMAFTDEARYPFWSPDSRYIGFFAQGKLKKIAASGGPAQSLCDAANGFGGSWNRDDVIAFSPNNSGVSIQRISANGGAPTDVTMTRGVQLFPVFLPGGSRFLYRAGGAAETSGIWVSSLDGKENRRVLSDASGAVFAPAARGERTGHLLFVRDNTLMSAPFDPVSAQVSGDVVPVSDGVPFTFYLPVTVSNNGVLLYARGGSAGAQNQIGWFDRTGKSLGPVGMPGGVHTPALSPDEKSVAFGRASSGGNDLWIRDLSRGTETRFTSDPSAHSAPSWSPRGDRIVFMSNRTGVYNLYRKATGGSGQDEPLLPNRVANTPNQWSRDGRFIVYHENDPKTKRDLWVLPNEGSVAERKPIPFLRTDANEVLGQLSPDSHWMAFTSDRSGKREVYVRPFPPGEGEWTISLAGGEMPRWRGDGKELFFEAADGNMMAVAVKAVSGPKPSFEAGTPVPLFAVHMAHIGAGTNFEYDVTADGKRFLINTTGGPGAASAPPLTVVTNWTAGLKK